MIFIGQFTLLMGDYELMYLASLSAAAADVICFTTPGRTSCTHFIKGLV